MNPAAQFRWGLLGYGDLAGKRVAAALHDAAGSSLHALWGRSSEKAARFAASHRIPHVHSSLSALLDDSIDAVYICTPPDTHAEYALQALAAGKHVLVEKPMAATARECEAMTDGARHHGRTLGVAYYRRAFPKMLKAKELIDAGVLGTPIWVGLVHHSWYCPAADDPKRWRIDPERSGGAGALADIGVHRLDLVDFWLGPMELRWSDRQRLVHSYEVEDGASLELRLAGGAPVSAFFAWSSRTFVDRIEIVGSEGRLVMDLVDGPTLTVVRGREEETIRIEPPANAHVPLVEDFVSAVHAGRAPLCPAEVGARTNRVLEAVVSNHSP